MRDREEEFFLCTPICWDDEEDDAFVNLILEYNKHLDHFQKLNLPYSYLEGICTFFSDCDELKNPPLLITKVFQRGDGDDFLTKPGGRYLSLIHKERWQDERQDYQVIERFQQYMLEQGLSAADNRFYCFELLNYVEDPESPEFVYNYEIRVK